ncbi:tetratricopeptide repeat protein [uncultured Thiodictyon sp.]|uniref:tetratricopeptide repeat protein n=1 Tax=uncultured Thiodictyon sp. TaxID=1846217 RepID=UPI0034522B05
MFKLFLNRYLPQAPVEWVARAYVNRGMIYGQRGDIEKEIGDYSAAIDLAHAPVEQVAEALVNRGITYGQIGESDKEIADYSAVINLPRAPVEQIASALFLRGVVYWQSSDAERSERDLHAVLRLEGAPLDTRVDSHLLLAEIRIATSHWDDAITLLGDGLREGKGAAPPYQGDSTDIITAFFDSSLQPAIRAERTRTLLQAYRDTDAVAQLGEALTQHLGRLHDLPSPDNLETWAAAWEAAGQGIDAFRLPLRLFRTGVDFLKAGGTDRGILLDLNQEERKLLEQVFNLEAET